MLEIFSNFKILGTITIVLITFFSRVLVTKSLKKIQLKFGFQQVRILVINKIITFLMYVFIFVIIAFIWGVNKEQLLIYVSSFLTVLGIAFFAQGSILSNITAGIILYINYPVKIGDSITILEKENDITGEIKNIGPFFITLITPEKEFITLPNAIILQKNIKYKSE
jgi:small-conductance mechanosensitive channel